MPKGSTAFAWWCRRKGGLQVSAQQAQHQHHTTQHRWRASHTLSRIHNTRQQDGKSIAGAPGVGLPVAVRCCCRRCCSASAAASWLPFTPLATSAAAVRMPENSISSRHLALNQRQLAMPHCKLSQGNICTACLPAAHTSVSPSHQLLGAAGR